jgi:starch synthase
MKIAYISTEVAPFSKTGGLGDVSAAIPKAMQGLGHKVLIISPLYKSLKIEPRKLNLVKSNILSQVGDNAVYFDLYVSFLPHTKLAVYFIKNNHLYRDGIYVDKETGEDYADSAYRFITFSKAVLATLKWLKFSPDVVHVNDWHTGLLPFFLKTEFAEDDLLGRISSVYTIHNIGYQGIYPLEKVAEAKIEDVYLEDELLGFYGQINFMKAGIVYSDVISTVSSNYAQEIQTKEYGFGLEEYIKEKKDDLYGIIHGVDHSVWNPKTDTLIKANYDSRSLHKKKENKTLLQRILSLEISDKPLIGIISRLATQKGLDLVLKRFNAIMKLDIQFVLLGTGEKELEEGFVKKGKQFLDNCSINIDFNNELAHKIEAGADIFLMPSVYEPCGLNQMYSMLYGTVPVVRKTGGLADTVQDYNPKTEEGTGFVFEKITAPELQKAVTRAVKLYKNEPKKWERLQKKIMNIDFSWKRAAKEWEEVYKEAVAKKKK